MTIMGTNMIDNIWPTLRAEGALSTASYTRITKGAVTSTTLISGTLGSSTFSTGLEVIKGDFRRNEIDGDRVLMGDQRIRFPSNILSIAPDADDQLVIGTDTYRVIMVHQPVDGASWELQVRTP